MHSPSSFSPVHVARLLDEVRLRTFAAAESRRRYASVLAPDFQLLDYLRNDEVGLSGYLAMLLDPAGAHGQGDAFLQGFLRLLAPVAPWASASPLHSVATEKVIKDQRRIDIYLRFGRGVIGIENKPWAGDQLGQLQDYADALRRDAAGESWLLVYLCNEEPTAESIAPAVLEALQDGGHYCRLSFASVAAWLDDCGRLSRAGSVRVFVESLAEFVRRHVNGELDMSETDELKALILGSDDHFASALRVAAVINDVRDGALAEFRWELDAALSAAHMQLIWDELKMKSPGQGCAGFSIRMHPGYQFDLRFEFAQSRFGRLEWGVCRGEGVKEQDQRWPLIHERMTGRFGSGSQSPHWPWYSGEIERVLPPGLRDWSVSPEPWLLIRDRTDQGLTSRLVKLAQEVHMLMAEIAPALGGKIT